MQNVQVDPPKHRHSRTTLRTPPPTITHTHTPYFPHIPPSLTLTNPLPPPLIHSLHTHNSPHTHPLPHSPHPTPFPPPTTPPSKLTFTIPLLPHTILYYALLRQMWVISRDFTADSALPEGIRVMLSCKWWVQSPTMYTKRLVVIS